MGHNVLQILHPMIGLDFHLPATPPFFHITGHILWGVFGVTAEYSSNKHFSSWGTEVVCKGSDIGPMIPHIPVGVMLPPPLAPLRLALAIAFSGSKSHFGSHKYKTTDKSGGAKSVALALIFVVNLNLNCGEPAPTPTGIVLAFNTHESGMTLGDFLAGLLSLILDTAVQTVLNLFGAGVGKWLLGKIAPKLAAKIAAKIAASPAAAKVFETVVGFFLGSPMGVDFGFFTEKVLGIPLTPYGLLTKPLPSVEDIIVPLIDGESAGEQH